MPPPGSATPGNAGSVDEESSGAAATTASLVISATAAEDLAPETLLLLRGLLRAEGDLPPDEAARRALAARPG